jgi:hypothetical protein
MSQKCTSSKKSSRDKYYDICNYCKKKGHWVKNYSKRKKKIKNPKNLKRKLIMLRKMNVETMLLTIQVKHLLLQLCRCLVMKLSINSNDPMHLYHHRRNRVFEFERISQIKIYMGNNSTQEVVEKIKIKIKIKIKMIVGANMILTMFGNDVIYIFGVTNHLCKTTSQR